MKRSKPQVDRFVFVCVPHLLLLLFGCHVFIVIAYGLRSMY